MGYDGLLYAVNNSNQMVAINTTTNTAAVVNTGISVQSNVNAGGAFYSLPDQIDGENYSNFRGVPPLNYPTPVLRSSGTIVNPSGGNYTVSNCNTLTIETTTGNYFNYTLNIYASNSSGAVGTQLYTSGTIAAAYPNSQDVSILGSTNIRNTPGYYLVRLTFGHACDNPQYKDMLVLSQNQFSYSSLGVNNTSAVTLANGNYKVYNCIALTLAPVTANQTQYKLSLQSATSTGQVITGAGTLSLVPPTFTSGTYPTTADLRTWPGTSNFIQSMSTGYILATLEIKDNCNASVIKTALLWVNSLGVGAADYLFNYGDGTTVDPDLTSLTAPGLVGQLALGVNAKSSTGYLDSYTMKIEKMNQGTGAVISTVCNYPAGTAIVGNSGTNIPSIGLNSYTFNKCGQVSAYFTQPANQNQVYRLTFVVNNACGASAPKVGFFQNADPNSRLEYDEPTTAEENLWSNGHAVFPNPSTGMTMLEYVLENPANVSLTITDAQGNNVATMLNNKETSAGSYKQIINLTNNPDGVYYYRLTTNKAIVGKIIKTSK